MGKRYLLVFEIENNPTQWEIFRNAAQLYDKADLLYEQYGEKFNTIISCEVGDVFLNGKGRLERPIFFTI